MSSKRISQEVKKQADKLVADFNQTVIGDPNIYYSARYRGRFLYLDLFSYVRSGPIMFAGGALATVPLMIVFFLFQKQLIEGVMSGAVKG